jgi:(1->4)-alpha-D-glucan 1-alpha-D-glucosylmutase
MKFQQFTGPVEAKGVEDTAFYRYNVLVSANDVGGHPQRLGVSVDQFHRMNRDRLDRTPAELIATATHDAKRGEDARARLNVISEMTDDWRRGVSEWMRINGGNRTDLGAGRAPDRNDEYLFYQALAGAWPAEPGDAPVPARASDDLVARISAYMQKAVREAKVHTSWIDEDQAYGEALRRFVERTLSGRTAPRFLASFIPIQRRLARVGMVNALAQLVLKLASPGVSDVYQGSELWNFDLVDPDNRRLVDYDSRRRLMSELDPVVGRIEAGVPAEHEVAPLLSTWHDGRIKLLVTMCGLRFRRRNPALMLSGRYVPLTADGEAADHLVAFARTDHARTLLCIVPRLVAQLSSWGSTRIALPEDFVGTGFRHLFTGAAVGVGGASGRSWIEVSEVFQTLPVALLAEE